MADTVTFTSESWVKYQYTIYDLTTTFKDNVEANYIYAKEYEKNGKDVLKPIYIGITNNLNIRMDQHENKGETAWYKENGANRILMHRNNSESDRDREESDLIAYYKPICNIQKNS